MKVFSRARIGLRAPRAPLASAGAILVASIHHGGEVGAERPTFLSGAATWRGWQDYHMDDPAHRWLDIGYNFGIDGLGRLYEGRPVGRLPAAVGGHNTNSVAFVFMQDGDRYGLNVLQRRTLKQLFEEGLPSHGVPPLKSLTVKGHREFTDHESNRCPGNKIMLHLGWRRRQY